VAGVRHRQLKAAVDDVARDVDRAAVGRVVDGVLDQVPARCRAAWRVGDQRRRSGDTDVDRLLLLRGDRLEVVGDAASAAVDIARHDLDRLLSRIEPRQPQQILDQPLHARRVS
jgi:hypothetical protein